MKDDLVISLDEFYDRPDRINETLRDINDSLLLVIKAIKEAKP